MAFPRADHDRDNGRPENQQRPKHDKRGQPGAAMQSGQDVLGRFPEGIRSTFEKTDLDRPAAARAAKALDLPVSPAHLILLIGVALYSVCTTSMPRRSNTRTSGNNGVSERSSCQL